MVQFYVGKIVDHLYNVILFSTILYLCYMAAGSDTYSLLSSMSLNHSVFRHSELPVVLMTDSS